MAIAKQAAEDALNEIEPNVQEELLRHPGRWVALTRSRVIVVCDSPTEAYDAARRAGIEVPTLYFVPDTRAGYSYF